MRAYCCITIRFLAAVLISCSPWIGETWDLYYLGGQSNMDGYGLVSELPDSIAGAVEGAYIFHGNTARDGAPVDGSGIWARLRPGHGAGISSDSSANYYSDRFGVELTFARRLRRLAPARRIAIIKYSKGGTSLDSAAAGDFGCWEPDIQGGGGINQYDHFRATVRNALRIADIDGDGKRDRLVPAGILWMQGEADASFTPEIAERYEAHLDRMMERIRGELGSARIPVVVGRISDSGRAPGGRVWANGDIVRAAQADYVDRDGNAALVTSTDTYGYSDPWHYDTAGFIDLGIQFAEAVYGLRNAR